MRDARDLPLQTAAAQTGRVAGAATVSFRKTVIRGNGSGAFGPPTEVGGPVCYDELVLAEPAFTCDFDALRAHVKTLSVERSPLTDPENLEAAFEYVHRHFERFGLEVVVDPFHVGPYRSRNVLGMLEPSLPSKTWVVLAAHVDAVAGSPGADDNASGVAALIECARVLSRLAPKHTVCFAATDLEEYGIAGARRLARRMRREGIEVRGMLALEMIGYTSTEPRAQRYPPLMQFFYPSTADFIALVGNTRSRKLLQTAAEAFRTVSGLKVETLVVPLDGWPLPSTRLSDHAPFWDCRYPALMATDTAFFRNPNYHRQTDTVDTLDFGLLGRVAEAVSRTISILAGAER